MEDPRCECKQVWRSRWEEEDMGYRREMTPGCDHCPPEPSPLPMLVDRYFQPVHGTHVVLVRPNSISTECYATATPERGAICLDWSNNRREEEGRQQGMSIRIIRRPAVRVGDRWLRRDPALVVMS